MLFGRAAIYFDEVARRGALRRAADVLHIAPSAVDRQIIQLEEELGTKLFERTASGMRMTAAGEVLVDGVRRWRRDLARIRSDIDNLVGLRRGVVSIALVEGAVGFVSAAIAQFQRNYPAIQFRMDVFGAQGVVDQVLAGEMDIGVTFNPPDNPSLRLERTMIYRLGLVVPPNHALAAERDVALRECGGFSDPFIVPGENLSLRRVLDQAWSRHVGGSIRATVEASSIELIKSLTMNGVGLGWLTAFDAIREIEEGSLRFLPVREEKIDLSTLSVISASGRTLAVPATLLLQQLGQTMEGRDVPVV